MKANPEQQFRGARLQTLISVSAAGGWNVEIANAAEVMEGAVFLYVYDQQTDKVWVCSISKTVFHDTREKLAGLTLAQSVRNLGRLIQTCISDMDLVPKNSDELGVALTAYIAKTHIYAHTHNATITSHFVCIYYRKSATVRPFALEANDRFLIPVDTVASAIHQVIEIDRQNHPEWLG